jgi:hypothetical protein
MLLQMINSNNPCNYLDNVKLEIFNSQKYQLVTMIVF